MSIDILESVTLDVADLIEELRFEFQHSPNFPFNPNSFSNINETSGDWVMCCCPNHAESRPSFGVSKEPPYHCNCFFCGYLGTIDKVIEISLGLDDGEGLKHLLSIYMVDDKRIPIDIESIIANGREHIELPTLSEQVLERYKKSRECDPWRYDVAIAYLTKERGLSHRTLVTYEIGVDTVNNCVVFPQRTRTGELRFLQKRRVGNGFVGAKFINDGHPIKKDILFGLHLIDRLKTTKQRIKRVRVVESPIDAMSNYEVGIAAVALNGRILFKNQIQALQASGIEVVDLMLDNDEAGRKGQKEAIDSLDKAGFIVNVVEYVNPFCKDANDLLRSGQLDKCSVKNINLINEI